MKTIIEKINEVVIDKKDDSSYIKVIDEDIITYEEGEFSDEPYSTRPDEYVQHDIRGIKIVKENENYDLLTDFEVEKGKDYYLVYVLYETGDSFGRTYGKIGLIDLFKDEEHADKLVKAIEENDRSYSKNRNTHREISVNINYKNDNGEDRKVSSSSWQGYFESLSDVTVIGVRAR